MSIIKIPKILLPKDNIDLKKWAVIACDQFTSQREYWDKLDSYCGEVSTLRITYPEIYLNEDRENRIKKINSNMKKYLQSDIFNAVDSFVLTVRTTKYGRKRVGLMISFDLEQYDYTKQLAVRATEATVPERLPVRVKIREKACLELPHALILLDDSEKSIIEPLYENRAKLQKLYSTELNNDGGYIEGFKVENSQEIIDKIEALCSKENLIKKYGSDKDFMFAVGDGNHSIATAKLCWESLKKTLKPEERENHPARYCLCELVNLYEEDLVFEPIHRVVFGVGQEFVDYMQKTLCGPEKILLNYNGLDFECNVDGNSAVAIGQIQEAIDKYLPTISGAEQDYVHGTNHTLDVAKENNGVAVFMPKLQKSDLFKYISTGKILTRKSFSMGEAEEKRYYLECKQIKEI